MSDPRWEYIHVFSKEFYGYVASYQRDLEYQITKMSETLLRYSYSNVEALNGTYGVRGPLLKEVIRRCNKRLKPTRNKYIPIGQRSGKNIDAVSSDILECIKKGIADDGWTFSSYTYEKELREVIRNAFCKEDNRKNIRYNEDMVSKYSVILSKAVLHIQNVLDMAYLDQSSDIVRMCEELQTFKFLDELEGTHLKQEEGV